MAAHWTEAEDTVLRRGWRAGDEASEIAERLPGRDEHSIRGRVKRLQLPIRRTAYGWSSREVMKEAVGRDRSR